MRQLAFLLVFVSSLARVGGAQTTAGSPADLEGVTFLTEDGRPAAVAVWLTILHNNDGESHLLHAGSGIEEFGGIDRFAAVVERLRREAGERVVVVSAGDNFLAGPEFSLSLERGIPFYDAVALDAIGYDALDLGNHDFDFGPDVLAGFIESFRSTAPPFLSANLDVSGEPLLAALHRDGRIAGSVVVEKGGERIGIVGITTPELAAVSSPGRVVVEPDVVAEVMAEVRRLEADAIDKIVLISHLQGLAEDLVLVPRLDGVDVVVAGGGDDLMANPGDRLIPGDEENVVGPYPVVVHDRDGTPVPIVTTAGQYAYVGRLVVGFDADGRLVAVDDASGPVRVAGGTHVDAVPPDPFVRERVVEPLVEGLEDLAGRVVGVTEVPLEGRRTEIRSRETNLGNLVADALLWRTRWLAREAGIDEPDVALVNGGAVRVDHVLPPGAVTALETFHLLPFPNFLTVVVDVPRSRFKELLENAVSRAAPGDPGVGSGRFAQVAGFRFAWDPTGEARVVDPSGDVLSPGSRVVHVTLDDGTPIVEDGVVLWGPPIDVATTDFVVAGGDEYPLRGVRATELSLPYQRAFLDYVFRGLGGMIAAADYPPGGEGRIVRLLSTREVPVADRSGTR